MESQAYLRYLDVFARFQAAANECGRVAPATYREWEGVSMGAGRDSVGVVTHALLCDSDGVRCPQDMGDGDERVSDDGDHLHGCGGGSGGSGSVRGGVGVGPNHARNLINREKKKNRKHKRQALGEDWRSPRVGPMKVQADVSGFWNSCSSSVRQELIDSKARMHIAQNEQRAQEAKERVDAMRSPVAIMKKAVALAEQASKIAKKEGDSKVMGWAKTVATSEAESLARSTPSSVPSFDEVHKSVSDVDVEEEFTPDSSLVSENENLKAKVKALQLERKQEGERVAAEKHAAVLARVAELEKQLLVQGKKKKPGFTDIVCDGMTEWQIKDLKKKNEALEREVEDAYRWKVKQDQVKQGISGSIWFGKQAAKK